MVFFTMIIIIITIFLFSYYYYMVSEKIHACVLVERKMTHQAKAFCFLNLFTFFFDFASIHS